MPFIPFLPFLINLFSAIAGGFATFTFLRLLPIPWYFSPFILWGVIAALSAVLFAMFGKMAIDSRKSPLTK